MSSQVPRNLSDATAGILATSRLRDDVQRLEANVLYIDEYGEAMSSGIECSFQGVENCNNGIHVSLEKDSCSISCAASD